MQPLTPVSPAGRCVEVQGPSVRGPIWAAGAPLGRDGARLLSQGGRAEPRGCLWEGTGGVAGGLWLQKGQWWRVGGTVVP